MTTEAEKQKVLEELSDLNDSARRLIRKYNQLAKKVEHTTRLGLCTGEVEFDDDDPGPDDIEEFVKYNRGYVGKSVDRCGAEAWFPSSWCF